jgi:hypothetical protein
MSRFRTTSRLVRYHVLLYAIVAAPLLAAGCGGGDDDDYALRTTPFRSNAVSEPGESGRQNVRACNLLRLAGLSPTPNNSLDLSICEWDGSGRHLKLMVDTAPKAQLRFYNLLSEQHEYFNADPELKARQIKGVGEDSAYGGAGAWWTRGRNQLVAYDHDRIVKVRVNVKGWSDARARASAIRIGKRAIRKMRRTDS